MRGMKIKKTFLPLLYITTIPHIHAMRQDKPIPHRISQISEFIDCIQHLQKQYPPSSPEYRKALIDLLDTKEYKTYEKKL
jgi:hypothetical protein